MVSQGILYNSARNLIVQEENASYNKKAMTGISRFGELEWSRNDYTGRRYKDWIL